MAARKLSAGKALSPATPRLPGLPARRPGRYRCQTAPRLGDGQHHRPPLRAVMLGWMGDEPTPGRPGRNGHGHHTQPHHQGDPKAGTRGARVDPLTDAFAVATAVIGAAAAMLPTGAAAGASVRILRSLPDQDTVADDQHGNLNGHPDNGRVQNRDCSEHRSRRPATPARPVTWREVGGNPGPLCCVCAAVSAAGRCPPRHRRAAVEQGR
jgi:hypothetical protein